MGPEKEFEEKVGKLVYKPENGDLNKETYDWLENEINGFLYHENASEKVPVLKTKKPQFNFIHDYRVKACANKLGSTEYCFIGISKGLINYSVFLFKNFFRDTFFLCDTIGSLNLKDEMARVQHLDFESWITFENGNGINEDLNLYTPSEPLRRSLSDILAKYFVFFVFLHGVGHLKQNKIELERIKRESTNDKDKNAIQQILEMDADKYALNFFVENLLIISENSMHPFYKSYPIFFSDKRGRFQYSLLICLLQCYMSSFEKTFSCSVSKSTHPHFYVRFIYISNLMGDRFIANGLLSADEWPNYSKDMLWHFNRIIGQFSPQNSANNFLGAIKENEAEIKAHYNFLLLEARKYNRLLTGDY